MGLSRRKFTKEFKEEALRRLELGASLAEVARACEVNPNVLHRWKRVLRDYGVKAFSGNGQRRAEDPHLPSWSARWVARRWRSIFCGAACSMSRSSESCKH